MARGELVLAVDQGSSSTKAVLVDSRARVTATASAPVSAAYPRPGWVEQSAVEIWDSVRQAVRSCVDGGLAGRVAALALSTQRESLLLWDRRTGEPLSPLVSWQDQRTAAACGTLLRAGHGPMVRERSGLPIDPMFSATRASWLLDRVDPDRRRARSGELCLGTVDSWLLSRLSRLGGEPVIEIGNASRTQLLNLDARDWDPALLDLFGVPVAALPRAVASTGPFPAVRRLDPLLDGTPVTAVLADSHAALFAHAGWRPGRVKATYGTGSSVMGVCVPAATADESLCRTIAWDDGAVAYAVEGNIRSSGATLSWLARCVGQSAGELAELAAGASSDGVHLVPAFSGLGAPWWDPHASALIEGLSLGTGLPQLARAALESIAFQVEDVVAAAEAAVGPVGTLLADGRPAANPTLMQVQADVGGRRVHRAREENLSALGAAQLAGREIGLWSRADLEELPREFDTFEPEAADPQRLRAGWRSAVARARGLPVGTGPGE